MARERLLFERTSERCWTNFWGQTSHAVTLRIYNPSPISGNCSFDAYVGAPSGYCILKEMADLVSLRQFCDDAIRQFSNGHGEAVALPKRRRQRRLSPDFSKKQVEQ